MRELGRGYGESWAGLAIPLPAIKCLTMVLPCALLVAGIKWVIARRGSPA